MKVQHILGLLLALGSAGPVPAQNRLQLSDVRLLLVAAIDAPDGRAIGVLTGDAADAVTERFRGATPIHVEISTLRRYAQSGCARLNLRIWQDGLKLPGTPAPRKQTLDVGINYCRDGQPPRSLD